MLNPLSNKKVRCASRVTKMYSDPPPTCTHAWIYPQSYMLLWFFTISRAFAIHYLYTSDIWFRSQKLINSLTHWDCLNPFVISNGSHILPYFYSWTKKTFFWRKFRVYPWTLVFLTMMGLLGHMKMLLVTSGNNLKSNANWSAVYIAILHVLRWGYIF